MLLVRALAGRPGTDDSRQTRLTEASVQRTRQRNRHFDSNLPVPLSTNVHQAGSASWVHLADIHRLLRDEVPPAQVSAWLVARQWSATVEL